MRANRSITVVGILGAVLAALLTVALVRPVDAQTTAVTNPVKIVHGYANGGDSANVPDATAKIRHLNVPPGTWAISAKLYVDHGNYAWCRLSSGNTYDDALVYGPTNPVAGTLSMNIVRTLTAWARATVTCKDAGSGMQWYFLKITAISAGSLTSSNLLN